MVYSTPINISRVSCFVIITTGNIYDKCIRSENIRQAINIKLISRFTYSEPMRSSGLKTRCDLTPRRKDEHDFHLIPISQVEKISEGQIRARARGRQRLDIDLHAHSEIGRCET